MKQTIIPALIILLLLTGCSGSGGFFKGKSDTIETYKFRSGSEGVAILVFAEVVLIRYILHGRQESRVEVELGSYVVLTLIHAREPRDKRMRFPAPMCQGDLAIDPRRL